MYRVVQDYLDSLTGRQQAATLRRAEECRRRLRPEFGCLSCDAHDGAKTAASDYELPRALEEALSGPSLRNLRSCRPSLSPRPQILEWGPEFGNDSAFARDFFDEGSPVRHLLGFTIPIRFWHGRLEPSHSSRTIVALPFAIVFAGADGPGVRRAAFHLQVRNKLDTWHPVQGELLTERERQCLIWAVRGKRFGDISKYLA